MMRDDPTGSEGSQPDPAGSDPALVEPRLARSTRLPGLREEPDFTSRPPRGHHRAAGANGAGTARREPAAPAQPAVDPSLGTLIETITSPFHCLYQDALHFHTQSRLVQSESEASRQARAAFLLYMTSAQALARQAAEELGRGEARTLLTNPDRPLGLLDVWKALPGVVDAYGTPRAHDPQAPPWPQLAELVALHDSWTHPGPPAQRAAYYRSPGPGREFEPLEPRNTPGPLAHLVDPARLVFPRTGLPRDPYALRPRHLDTVRGVLDAAIDSLDRQMEGALLRGQRHRLEPVRVLYPPPGSDS